MIDLNPEEGADRDITLTQALEALRLTVEYVGLQTLRPFPGWSWYDVLSKRREYAEWLESMVNPKPVVIDPADCVGTAPHRDEEGGA